MLNVERVGEVKQKEKRLMDFLLKNDYDAAVIGRSDNFAWLTGGGENKVIQNTDVGFSYIVFMPDKKYIVSQVMDAYKVMDEEVDGLEYILESLKWFEKSKEQKVLELVKGLRVISDINIPGCDFKPEVFYRLHYPLTENEIYKLKWLGRKTEEIISQVATQIRPGMTECEVQGKLASLYYENNISISVMIVGSDYRISAYRHCLPTEKKIEKLVLLSPAVRKWGLHANVARMVHFGPIPEETKKKYSAVCEIEAEVISMCTPGTKFADILRRQKQLYKELGYEDEWQHHYQGGITGYMVSDPKLCMDESSVVSTCQAFDWFITITGTKGEELSINCGNDIQVPSSKRYMANEDIL